MNDGFKVLIKSSLCPHTSCIIFIWSLNAFSIQFWYKKVYFCYFLVTDLKNKKEIAGFQQWKEKIIIGPDFDHQNSWLFCQMILFDEGISIYIFFSYTKSA